MTGVFAIIVCGTLGTLAIHLAAPHLLAPAEPDGSEEGEGEEADVETEAGAGAALPSDLAGADQQAAARAAVRRNGARLVGVESTGGSQHGVAHQRRLSAPNLAEQVQGGAGWKGEGVGGWGERSALLHRLHMLGVRPPASRRPDTSLTRASLNFSQCLLVQARLPAAA